MRITTWGTRKRDSRPATIGVSAASKLTIARSIKPR